MTHGVLMQLKLDIGAGCAKKRESIETATNVYSMGD